MIVFFPFFLFLLIYDIVFYVSVCVVHYFLTYIFINGVQERGGITGSIVAIMFCLMIVRIGQIGYKGWVGVSDDERFMTGLLMLDFFFPIIYDFSPAFLLPSRFVVCHVYVLCLDDFLSWSYEMALQGGA